MNIPISKYCYQLIILICLILTTKSQITIDCTQLGQNIYSDLPYALGNISNLIFTQNSTITITINPQPSCTYTLGSNNLNSSTIADVNLIITGNYSTPPSSLSSCNSSLAIIIVNQSSTLFQYFNTIIIQGITFNILNASNALNIARGSLFIQDTCFNIDTTSQSSTNYNFITILSAYQSPAFLVLNNVYVNYTGQFFVSCETDIITLSEICTNQIIVNPVGLIRQNTSTVYDLMNNPLNVTLQNITMNCNDAIYLPFLTAQNVQNLTIKNMNSNCLPNIEVIVLNKTNIANINFTNTTTSYPFPVQNIQNIFTITINDDLNLINMTFANWYLNLVYDIGNNAAVIPIYLMSFFDNNTDFIDSSIIVNGTNIINNNLNGTLFDQGVSLLEMSIMSGCVSKIHILENINIQNNTVANVTNLFVFLLSDSYNATISNIVYDNNIVLRIISITQNILSSLGTLAFSNIQIINSTFDMTDYTDTSGAYPLGIIDIYVYDYFSFVNFNNVSILNNNINNTFFIQVLNYMGNNNFTNSTVTFLSLIANNNTGKGNTFFSSGNINVHFYYSSISYNNFTTSTWLSFSTIGNPLLDVIIAYSNLLNNTLYDGTFLINSGPLITSLIALNNIMVSNNGVLQLPFWLYVYQTIIDGWNMYDGCNGFQISGVPNMFFFNNTISNIAMYNVSNFFNSLNFLSELHTITFGNASFYNYSGYFWNPNANLTAVLNNTIFDQSQGLSYVGGALGFIYRITDNIWLNIEAGLTNPFLFTISMMNQSYIVIDDNFFNNWTLINSTDNAIFMSQIYVFAISNNYWYNVTGKGYMAEVDTHNYANFSENYIYDCSLSFVRMIGIYVINTNFIGNTIDYTEPIYPFITMQFMFSDGIVSLISNTFTNMNITIDPQTYLQINLFSLTIVQSNPNIPGGINLTNNTIYNIIQDNNHPFIRQYHDSTLYISSPDNWIFINNNTFANSTVLYESSFFVIVGVQIIITNSLFYNISSYDLYGNIYILTEGLTVVGSNFSYMIAPTANGGAFYIDYDLSEISYTMINITESIFTNNVAQTGTDVFYQGRNIGYYESNNTRNYGNLSAIDSIFLNYAKMLSSDNWNGSFIGGFLTFFNCNIINFTIQNTILNTRSINEGLIMNFNTLYNNANITFLNLTANSNQDIITFASLKNSSQTILLIDSMIIPNETDILAFQMIQSDSGFVEIRNMELFNFSVTASSFIVMICTGTSNYSTLYIHDSLFSDFPIEPNNVGMVHLSDQGGQSSCNLNIIAENVIFDQLYMQNSNYDFHFGSFLYVDYSYNFSAFVNNCTFQNSIGNKGPAITINNYNEVIFSIDDPNLYLYNTSIVIQNSKFLNNTAYLEGGSIYNEYDLINVTNCTFINNSALFRTGASLYSSNYTSLQSILDNEGNTFQNNTRYAYYTTENNEGLEYADHENVGTLPNILFPPPEQVYDWYSSEEIIIDQFNILNASTLSLQHMEWNMYLIDYLGQIMYQDTRQIADDSLVKPLKQIQMLALENLFSTNKCDMKWCNITNCTLELQGNAYTNVSVYISYLSSQFELKNDIYITSLRPCVVGEINTTFMSHELQTSQCKICGTGQFSLNLSDQTCNTCPLNANCSNGGNYIVVDPGYWRSNVASYNIIPCRYSLACIGTYDSICFTGYQGPLCDSCDGNHRYIRSSSPDKCNLCPENHYQSSLLSIATILLTIIYQVWFIKCTLVSNRNFIKGDINEETEMNSKQAMYIRLLMTYSQIIAVLATLRLNIIDHFQQYLGPSTQIIGNPTSSSVGSTLCTMLDWGFNPQDIFYYKMIMMSTLPFIKLIIINLFRLVFWKFKLTRKHLCICIITAVCIIIMEQPGLFNVLVTYLTCVNLSSITGPESDTNYYIMSDLGYQCYTDRYYWYLYFVVLPSLLFWGIIVPIGFSAILFSHRRDLQNQLLRLNMGAIFNEYSERAYFWGIMLMILKLLLNFVSSVLYNDPKTNGLTIFVIIYVYFLLLVKFKPYTDLELYRAEQVTIVSFLLTIFFAIYYIGNQFTATSNISVAIIVLTNIFVVLYLIYKIIKLNMVKIKPIINQLRVSIIRKKSVKNTNNNFNSPLNESTETNMDIKVSDWPKKSDFTAIELSMVTKK